MSHGSGGDDEQRGMSLAIKLAIVTGLIQGAALLVTGLLWAGGMHQGGGYFASVLWGSICIWAVVFVIVVMIK